MTRKHTRIQTHATKTGPKRKGSETQHTGRIPRTRSRKPEISGHSTGKRTGTHHGVPPTLLPPAIRCPAPVRYYRWPFGPSGPALARAQPSLA